MALPFVESFTGTAAVLPDPPFRQAALSATTLNRDGSGNAKASASDASNDVMAYDDSNSYSPDQYARVAIGGGLGSGTSFVIAIVRASGTGGSFQCYEFISDGSAAGAGHTELYKYLAGAGVVKANFATAFTNGDVLEIRAIGTTLYVFKNGVQIGSFTDVTAPILSGAAGCGVFNTANNALISDFEGGELSFWASLATRFPIFQLLFPNRPFGNGNPLREVKQYAGGPPTAGAANTPISLDVISAFAPGVTMQTSRLIVFAVSSTFGVTLSQLRSFLRPLTVTSGFVPLMQRNFPRALAVASSFVAAMVTGRAYSRALSATATLLVSLVKSVGYQRTLAAASTFTAALARVAAHPRILAVTSTFTAALQKGVAKTLAVTSAFTAAMTKTTAYQRVLAATSAFTPALNRTAAHFCALAAASAFTAAITVGRGFFRTLAVGSTFTAAITRLVTHTYLQSLAATSAFTVSLTRAVAYKRALAVASSYLPALVRVASHPRTLAVVSPMVVVLRRGIAMRLAVGSVFGVMLNRGLGRLLAVSSPFLVSIIRGSAALFSGFLTHIQAAFTVRALDGAAFETEAEANAAFEARSST